MGDAVMSDKKANRSILLDFINFFSFKSYAVGERLVRAKRSRAIRELLASAQAYFQRACKPINP
jgi:phage gp46-like protein